MKVFDPGALIATGLSYMGEKGDDPFPLLVLYEI